MIRLKHQHLLSPAGRPFNYDLYLQADGSAKPLLLFAHGFKGFKDWGHWEAIAERFADAGFAFLKFNFSHNGVSPEKPTEFEELEAFGENNYSKELQDLDAVLDACLEGRIPVPASEIDRNRMALIGHSRGGGLAIVKCAADPRIRALITWAAVDRLDNLWKDPATVEKWKETGRLLLHNSRTGQLMPLHLQLYQDYERNKDRYQVEAQAPRVTVPWLILHGTADPTIPPAAAANLHRWHPQSRLEWIEGADHVFGGSHPWPAGQELPPAARHLADKTINWLKSQGW